MIKRINFYRIEVEKKWGEKYWNFILNYKKKKSLNWHSVCINPNLTAEMINRYLNGNMYHAYESLSGNPNLTWDIVRNNIDKSWKWRLFLSNSNIIPIFLQKTISNILGFFKIFFRRKKR